MKTKRDNRRRMTALLAILTILSMLLAACSSHNGTAADEQDGEEKLSVVTSIYPLYFLASSIGGDHVDVVNLVPAGVEPHDWTPKSRDLIRVSKADLFVYNGAGLEGWTHDFLEGIQADSDVRVIEASAGIALISGNPEDEHEHEAGGHDHADGEEAHTVDDGHDHGLGVDPHTWVSPKSMMVMAETLRGQFAAIDPANAAAYEAGYEALLARLSKLDAAFEQRLAELPKRDIIVSHQAFGYLCRDYGLNQIAIMGLSPEAEPKAKDLARIAAEAKANGITYIFFEELVSDDLARTLANEAGAEVLVLNPVEGLTPEQEAQGEDYVTIMETNLQNLIKALQ